MHKWDFSWNARMLHLVKCIGVIHHIGEGNGNPLQCSCLENPVDRGAWWAVVHGVAKSRTRLKRLSKQAMHHIHITQGKIMIISINAEKAI